jgi:hypothetical protein
MGEAVLIAAAIAVVFGGLGAACARRHPRPPMYHGGIDLFDRPPRSHRTRRGGAR